jgi:hypothetical protein
MSMTRAGPCSLLLARFLYSSPFQLQRGTGSPLRPLAGVYGEHHRVTTVRSRIALRTTEDLRPIRGPVLHVLRIAGVGKGMTQDGSARHRS